MTTKEKKKREDKRSRVTFSPTEYAVLKLKAKRANRTVKDYVLDCTFGPAFIATESRAFLELHESIEEVKNEVHTIYAYALYDIRHLPCDYKNVLAKMDKIINLEKKIYREFKKQGGGKL